MRRLIILLNDMAVVVVSTRLTIRLLLSFCLHVVEHGCQSMLATFGSRTHYAKEFNLSSNSVPYCATAVESENFERVCRVIDLVD